MSVEEAEHEFDETFDDKDDLAYSWSQSWFLPVAFSNDYSVVSEDLRIG